MAVDYEWRIYSIDKYGDREIMDDFTNWKQFDEERFGNIHDTFRDFNIELWKQDDYEIESATVFEELGTNRLVMNREFNYGSKIPARFHKQLAQMQGVVFEIKPVKKQYKHKKSPEYVDYVKSTALSCAKYLEKNTMVKKPKTFTKELLVTVKQINGSWGGVRRQGEPFITIPALYEEAKGKFHEYARIRKIKGIGEFHSDDTNDHIHAVVAHEIAHAVDYWNGVESAHGSEWRVVYRALRKHLNVPEV